RIAMRSEASRKALPARIGESRSTASTRIGACRSRARVRRNTTGTRCSLDRPSPCAYRLVERSINMPPSPSDTRERLLRTAMQLFWEEGYGSTSIADILQAAKVNSGSLYYFFPTKQDLLLAVLDLYHSGIEPMLLEPAWKGVEDPIEKVFALLARYREG